MLSKDLEPVATWEFEAEVLVLHHPTTISARYQAMGKLEFTNRLIFPLEFTHPNSLQQEEFHLGKFVGFRMLVFINEIFIARKF